MPSESRRTPSRGPRGRSLPRRGQAPRVSEAPAAAARSPRFTGRAAILILVVSVLAVSYASSMRAYLQQRDQIGDLKDQIALRQASISDLEREKRRWDDPAYVRQQARELNFVMPGETAYVVLDENGDPLEHETSLTDPSTLTAPKPPTAWWDTAWQSVELAGHPPKPEPPPETKLERIN